eukprot:GHVR01078158.1.p2 GENE.GHVR01078158.1~~GHVR01078158.1.p2  ORF type:complete len:129 (+),score=21.32 GHVR01078158.1:2258-2644(+)
MFGGVKNQEIDSEYEAVESTNSEKYKYVMKNFRGDNDAEIGELERKIRELKITPPEGSLRVKGKYFSTHPGRAPVSGLATRPIRLPWKNTSDRYNLKCNFGIHTRFNVDEMVKIQQIDEGILVPCDPQ